MKAKFRLPSELKKSDKDKRVPVSARIPSSMDQAFGRIAAKNNISKAKLIESVLEDYLAFVNEHTKR